MAGSDHGTGIPRILGDLCATQLHSGAPVGIDVTGMLHEPLTQLFRFGDRRNNEQMMNPVSTFDLYRKHKRRIVQ